MPSGFRTTTAVFTIGPLLAWLEYGNRGKRSTIVRPGPVETSKKSGREQRPDRGFRGVLADAATWYDRRRVFQSLKAKTKTRAALTGGPFPVGIPNTALLCLALQLTCEYRSKNAFGGNRRKSHPGGVGHRP